MKTDCLVLGAGMVGISAALHLQKRGRSVVLIDRRGAAEETSFGNAGIIQREGVVPYMFPRDPWLVAKYAFNMLPEAHYQLSSLPSIAPWLYRYWRNSTADGEDRSARALRPLVERCIAEHEALMAVAGLSHDGLRRTGYLRVYPEAADLEAAIGVQGKIRERYGVAFEALDESGVKRLEPHLTGTLAGGIQMSEAVSVADPAALGKAYAEAFVKAGGRLLTADARTLDATTGGWRIGQVDGAIEARDVVLALGPWSDEVFRPLGYRFPLAVKRGYHMHYQAEGNAVLNRPVVFKVGGYALVQTTRGIRLTTGAEFATRDAPPTPAQLEATERLARRRFPLGKRLDEAPWLGSRPCLPDMLPVIGAAPRHKGLWLDFGHHHLGFTLGPVSGRLIAEMMTGEAPVIDPAPYRADRF